VDPGRHYRVLTIPNLPQLARKGIVISGSGGTIMKMNVRLAIALLAFAAAINPHTALAQDQDTDNRTHMATGCLVKGAGPNIYSLTDENGKLWVIHGGKVRLNSYVGQTVTVTGTNPKGTKDTDTSPQNDLVVTKVEKVSDSCTQP
jgi:hypothetical protein